jgi:Protein of unknown function (DUF664)
MLPPHCGTDDDSRKERATVHPSAELLVDAFDRVRGIVHRVVDGLTPEQLSLRVAPEANSIAWLVWHLTRIQDDHVADAAQTEQLWTADGWAGRLGLPFGQADTGYGHTTRDVAAVQLRSSDLLTGYHDAVHGRTSTTSRALPTPIWTASSTRHGTRRCR